MKRSLISILTLFFILIFSNSSFASKRALLVGIDTYKNLPIVSNGRMIGNLKGAVNDVNMIKKALLSYYGFSENDIKVLTNEVATRQNIEFFFNEWLVKTKEGDVVVFYFSGHGSKVEDYNNDERDGYDEVLLPYDMVPNGGYNIIVDDELGMWIRKLSGRTVTIIIDSCYSGGVVRSINGKTVSKLEDISSRRPKFIPITNYRPSPSVIRIPKGVQDVPESVIFMTASKENEIALEVSSPWGFHGGFTFALFEGMRNLRTSTYERLFTHVKKVVRDSLQLPQEPQIVARKDIIAGTVFENPRLSEAVKPQVTQKPNATALGESKPPLHAATPQAPSWIRGERVLLKVDPIKGANNLIMNSLRNKLLQIPYIEIVEDDFFDRMIRGELRDGIYYIRILNRIGDVEKVLPSKSIDELIEAIVPQLEYAYMVKQLAHIHNPRPQFTVRLSVADENRRDFRIGEKITFKVQSERDSYILLINMDSRGNFHIIFPNKFHQDNFIKAGTEVVIPDEEMRRRSFEFEFSLPAGEETVKVIAATRPLNLEKLGIADFRESFPVVRGGTRIIMVKQVIEQINDNIEAGDNGFEWAEDTVVVRSHRN